MAIRYEKDDENIVILTLDQPGRSVNLLGQELFDAFEVAVGRLLAEELLAGVILTSAKTDFIHGGDLDLLYQARDPAWLTEWGMAFKRQLRRLETLGRPVVAAINGTALGGGLEITLACHHRILLNQPRVKLGFPEIQLGLFPGGGGTQRLPRMIGVQQALPLILEGRELTPHKALEIGLVDELTNHPDELLPRARAWIARHPESSQPWDRKAFRWPGGDPKGPQMGPVWMMSPTMLAQKTRGHYPAALNALAAVYEGSQVDFDTADRIESRYFAKTVVSKTAKNMINVLWYQMNQIRKGSRRPETVEKQRFSKVGVLGAGMMGAGIAYAAAASGLSVVLKDLNPDLAAKGKAFCEHQFQARVQRGSLCQEAANAALARILATDKTADLSGCELVIEAVFENRELKASVTRETEAVLDATSIFASNTSTLPISGLAGNSVRPENFIGLHFFSPVDKMKLVEIILGQQTSQETLARAMDFVFQIGKLPIVVNDSRGFFTSRVFRTYVLEGLALLAEGMHPRLIESAGLAAGMPVGPLAISDEVSLSLMHHINAQTRRDLDQEGKTYEEHPGEAVIMQMVERLNRPGKKAGQGFYEYPESGPKYLWPGLAEVWPLAAEQLSQDEMIQRLMFVQSLESVRCLEENVITSVADGNVGSILGIGFPPFKGGALQYINDYGHFDFINRAEDLAARFGPRFKVPGLLKAKFEAGDLF